MAKKKHHILIEDVPHDLQAVSDRLEQLSDALYTKRENGGLSVREQNAWTGILDYWYHVEVANGERKAEDLPVNDPLRLLDVAEKFNLAAPEQIRDLRNDFMKQAAKIMGHEVTPAQVRKLYKLLADFNPAKPR